MGMLRVNCTCGQHFKVSGVALGDTKKCPRCASTLTITRENTAPVVTGKASARTKPRIGELLVKEGLITEGQLREALAMQKAQGGKTVQNLIALQYIDPPTFVKFLSKLPGVASIDLTNYTIPKDVIALIPADYARKYEILPIDKMSKDLTVGMACPLDAATISKLEEMTSLRIKPLLVSLSDIKAAIDGYYPVASEAESGKETTREGALTLVKSTLTFENVLALIRDVEALPALPETVHKVRATMEDPESSTVDMARIISSDPALSAKLISLANSAAYGFAHKVESVEMATALLGLREVYSVVTASAVIDYFESSKHFDYRAFWKRSMFCGTATKIIAKSMGKKDTGGLFTAGILHDLGRAVFAYMLKGRYAHLNQSLLDEELIALETENFGIAHPEVGFLVAEQWELPVEIRNPIRFHHDVTLAEEGVELVAIVALAAEFADHREAVTKENLSEFIEEWHAPLDILHLDELQVGIILDLSAAVVDVEL